jgi:DNA-binding NarL/FixJ family response regulator
MTSIALIDDHPMLTNTLGAWLEATGRISVAGTAKNLTEARTLIESLDPLPHIIILDISVGKEDGLAFIPQLKKICAKRKENTPGILVCTMHEDPFIVKLAMDLGAAAYVAKSAESGEILAAIDKILSGDTYVSHKSGTQEQQKTVPALTRRENEIAALVKQSLTTGQIAGRLSISIRTVEFHLANIYQKTGVSSREELFRL